MVLKATLDAAGGENPLPSIIAAIFLLSITATKLMLQSWNSGSDTATTDMLQQLGLITTPPTGREYLFQRFSNSGT
jgi:hypothetical protein